MLLRRFQGLVFGRRWLIFIVMGLALGAGTFNLFILQNAKTDLALEHGWMALVDGGAAQQLVELLVTAYLGMAALYVLFKGCEHRLVRWLAEPGSEPK